MKNIVLLIRSFNRPKYLKSTLKSILSADIDLCIKRYIYDDGSNDQEINNLLTNPEYINVKNKEFIVFKNKTNQGCKLSYVTALNIIKYDNSNLQDFLICTIDNDVIVKPEFITHLTNGYDNIFSKYKHNNILLTGFNPTNAHLTIIEDNGSFYRKTSCGGVNFVFHINFIDFIIEFWIKNLDWGVIYEMVNRQMPICSLKKSVINHCGHIGLNSRGEKYTDTDVNF